MSSDAKPYVLRSGDLVLEVGERTLVIGQHVFHLTPKECRLLETFLTHQGQVLTRQFLMREVWHTDFVDDTRTLEVHVHWIRRKLEEGRHGPSSGTIHTVRGVGYLYQPLVSPHRTSA
ncbi:MAG: response regulator transcription factor [Ardenticatenales bacterium]